jgi:phospholipid/cholesterol/gamma-HCH transport system substrate-binding protein
MKKSRDAVLVGLLLIFAVTVGVLGTIWLVRGGLAEGYSLYARFPWGSGLRQGQPVLLAGVTVGTVGDVHLDPNGTIVVRMAIDEEFGIPVGSTATVVPVGIFGDQSVALTPVRASTQYIAAGDTVPVGIGAPAIGDLLARGDTIARDVNGITAELERQLVDSGGVRDLRRTLAATNALVVDANRLIAQVGAVAAEQSRQLSLTQATLRRSVAALDSAAIDSTVKNLRATSANVTALTGDLRTTTTELNGLLAGLRDTTGTAGKLLNDPQLYNNLQRLVARIDSLTLDFQKNPRRYINLEIF